MNASSTTAQATNAGSDAAINILTIPAGKVVSQITVMQNVAAPVACFVSFDGGTNWGLIPAGCAARTFPEKVSGPVNVMLKRVPGGSDVTGIYCDAI